MAKTGWALLHSPLPAAALKPLNKSVYGVDGLTDVNEGYLIERLHQCGLAWEEHVLGHSYLGSEDREVKSRDGGGSYTVRYYMAEVHLALLIDGRRFDGVGAHDNRKLDAAFKGARTVAFKSACKDAGMTVQLYKGGKAMDVFYGDDSGQSGTTAAAPPPPSAPRTTGLTETQQQRLRALNEALPVGYRLQPGARKALLEEGFEVAERKLLALHNEAKSESNGSDHPPDGMGAEQVEVFR